MKHLLKLSLSGFLLVAIGLIACIGQSDGVSQATAEEAARAKAVAEPATAALMAALQKELSGAIQQGGMEAAIDVCAESALALTDSVVASVGVLGLRRTSFLYRNPANAPDAFERKALEQFEAAERSGAALESLTQKIREGNDVHLRYYKPLRVGAMCVTCHGQESDIPEVVRARLSERYPDDRAKGFQAGDFRGVIRVSVAADDTPPK